MLTLRRHALACLLIASLASGAFADDAQQSLGDGYTLIVDRNGLHVVKGKRRARLVDAQSILAATVDNKTKQVDVKVSDFSCAGESKYHWTLTHLDARIENTAAYRLHKNKDYVNAAAGFAKAVAADPGWNLAAYNLASAQQLAGDKDAATTALAPWLASAPIATYVQVTADPELAPLLERPELKAIRAALAGTATISAAGELDGKVAYSKDKGLIASTRTERSWGACVFQTELELHDAKTGSLVAHTPIIAWSETADECDEKANRVVRRARPIVAKRIMTLTAMLRELGFVKVKTEKGAVTGDLRKGTARFAKAKLGVVMAGGTARILVKDTEVGTAKVLELLVDAVYVDEPRMMLLWTLRPGAEGCEGSDPTEVAVIPLAKP